MKSNNQLIKDYTHCLQQGEMHIAYKGIIDFIGKLRADFIKNYSHLYIGSIYQGYLDMSYFSINTEHLKGKGLKVAIVYLHEKRTFEVWLSARNRKILKRYEGVIKNIIADDANMFHDDNNQDSIIEYKLTSDPNFDNEDLLINIIEQGVEKFMAKMSSFI